MVSSERWAGQGTSGASSTRARALDRVLGMPLDGVQRCAARGSPRDFGGRQAMGELDKHGASMLTVDTPLAG